MKILIIGNGWIGQRCKSAWSDAVISDKRIMSVGDVLALINEHHPDAILNAAGVVGRPNVDWCEDYQIETIQGNTILPILIAEACQQKNVYLLHIGTGCVYYGYSSDPKGWKESDFANPLAVYTKTKYAADLTLSALPNVGIGRIRMPTDYIPSPANLIDKLIRYSKVADVINSVTVLEDMIEVFRELLVRRAGGIFHVTNPGAISHREIIKMYEELVDPAHHNEWITEEELVTSGLAKKKRSNNILQSPNLEKLGIKMRPVHEAVRDTMEKYAKIKNSNI
ncbi:MAG: NAD-dependent epimerase/dehydratase family protein [Candidatus Magasanikbacteria bacterium]|nr:NAD-dependent epimerase/dehydratase family protein [Candidatus Magasanikbacteria bacterium]